METNDFFKDQKNFWENTKKRRTPNHPVIKAFAEPKINFILSELEKLNEKPKNLTIIDVGCGNGFLSYYLEREFKDIMCVDFAKAILDLNPCRNKIQATAENLPFPDKSFDVAFSSNILHHLQDPILAIKEMKRVAKKYIIISDVNRKNFIMNTYGLIKKKERGITRLPRNYLDLYLKEINVKIITKTDIGLILPNITKKSMIPLLRFLEKNKALTPFYSMVIAKV